MLSMLISGGCGAYQVIDSARAHSVDDVEQELQDKHDQK
jgi:hypothetical protein